jgi:PAS domain S-box-containing protein
MDRIELELWTGREVERLVALLESQSWYYREILASLPVAAMIVSGRGTVVSTNRAFRRLLGVGSEDLRRKSFSQILPSAPLESSVSQTLREGPAHSGIPVEILGRTFHASVVPVRSQHDEVDAEALITFAEVSPTVVATDVPSLPDIPGLVWSLRPDTMQFESVDGANEHLLGYSRQHWLSTPAFWLERVHAEDRTQVNGFYQAALARGGEFACEFRAMTANSKIVWRRDSFRVVLDDEGRVARIRGITVDITSRRQAEVDNLQANRVEALAVLSSRLSHDLNNALMIVAGYGEELLASFPEGDARRADVQAILSAAEKMAGITGELHGFTRKQGSPPAATDVSSLLTEVAARIRHELGATLVLRLPQTQLTAFADATQLEAALVSIARRLRDKADPHMIVAAAEMEIQELSSLTHAMKPGRYIDISVRGPAASEVPPSSFEAFLSGTDSHGADMARTYAIVREWGGTILTGRMEHSSEIRVLLPAAEVWKPVLDRMEEPQPAESTGPRASDLGTVLVVEDEKGIRDLVRRILTREGYKVLEASSAEQALDVARRHAAPIRLLLADMLLPGKSGRELAEELALTQPNLHVLYISGYTNDPAAIDARLVSGSALLQKPFTLAALLKKVHEALESVANELPDST